MNGRPPLFFRLLPKLTLMLALSLKHAPTSLQTSLLIRCSLRSPSLQFAPISWKPFGIT